MSRLVSVLSISDIAAGGSKVVDVDGVSIAVFNIDGEYFAIANKCPHKGNLLCDGELEGHRIICPGHRWDFDLRTGETSWDPLIHKTYRIVVEDGSIKLEV